MVRFSARVVVALVGFAGIIHGAELVDDERIHAPRNPSKPSTGIDVVFVASSFSSSTSSSSSYTVCWAPRSQEEYGGPAICADPVSTGHNASMYTIVGHRFTVASSSSADAAVVMFETVGGQHVYHVDALFDAGSAPAPRHPDAVVHVRTPDTCPVDGWESVGPLWRDAVRRAAKRRGHSLCLCGAWNDSTSFTAAVPNPELPDILTSLHRTTADHPACRCDQPDGTHSAPY